MSSVPSPSHKFPPPSTLVRPGDRVPPVAARPAHRPDRGWAWAGVAAGLLGPAVVLGTSGIYTQDAWEAADNGAMARSVTDFTTVVWAHQALVAVVAGLLVVFGVGLRRHLTVTGPAHSLVPDVAAAGVLLTAAAMFLGAGLDTELWWSVQAGAKADPDTVGSLVTWYGTVPWLWGGLGLSAAAVARGGLAHGGLAHGSGGRVVAWASAVLAVLLAATQAAPVQYIAILPGALWLLVVGVAGVRRTGPAGHAG